MLVSVLVSILLPVTVLAAPGQRDLVAEEVSEARMAVRETKYNCAIVNVSTKVNCRKHPSASAEVITSFTGGSKHDFICLSRGDCIDGNW